VASKDFFFPRAGQRKGLNSPHEPRQVSKLVTDDRALETDGRRATGVVDLPVNGLVLLAVSNREGPFFRRRIEKDCADGGFLARSEHFPSSGLGERMKVAEFARHKLGHAVERQDDSGSADVARLPNAPFLGRLRWTDPRRDLAIVNPTHNTPSPSRLGQVQRHPTVAVWSQRPFEEPACNPGRKAYSIRERPPAGGAKMRRVEVGAVLPDCVEKSIWKGRAVASTPVGNLAAPKAPT
jgi:hypothetical protein